MIKKSTRLLPFAIILILFFNTESFSQDKWWKEKKYKSETSRNKYELCKKTFKDIGFGFASNNINFINLYFDSQVYLNIISNEKGYYSPNQAEIILLDFMEYFTIDNIKYQRSSKFNTYAFVNGVYSYMKGSGKRDLGITISLKYNNNRWFIDQININ
ncbi:MAG: DUF4783 domain-containing protein [Ignavibacteria bacterium]